MAISTNESVLNALKIYYKDGVESLIERDSPVAKMFKKIRIEGKEARFPAIAGRGAATCADAQVATAAAASSSTKNVEFKVTPGKVFSVYTINADEILASKTNKGAYMHIAANKLYGSTGGLRQQMGAAFYGDGKGTIALAPTTALNANQEAHLTLPYDAIVKFDVDSVLNVYDVSASANACKLTVKAINDNVVTVMPSQTFTPAAEDLIRLETGAAELPMGLDGWLPVKGKRSGWAWTNYIGTEFMGVNRSTAASRLAGQFYDGTKETVAEKQKKSYALKQLLAKVRRAGSKADLLILNDEDWLEVSAEIEATNTYFTQTSTKTAKQASIGIKDMSAAFSTNFIENIIDDPYCPKGKFYILESSAVELWSYTNPAKLDNGIAGNNPGVEDPMNMNGDSKDNSPYQLNIDDYLTIQPGAVAVDGPSSNVTLRFTGSYVVLNPAHCGVGIFYGANPVGV